LLPAVNSEEPKYYWSQVLVTQNLAWGNKAVVIGDGLIVTETVSKLVRAENKVILVDMLSEIARGREAMEELLT
jgi:pyruvate/2-oxoglutarate dehydrogenase complex dihydrolipoamide dehydrogenase (E3) component